MIITHVQRISLWFVVLLAFANAQGPMSSSSEDVFGEYCFAKEKSKEGIVWKWEKYKGNQSYLFSYIPCAYKYKYSFFPDDDIVNGGFGQMLENSNYNEKKNIRMFKGKF